MGIKIGITGGIGSGKSVVSHLLRIMGIPVYDADTEAKKITQSDKFIRERLIALLGEEVYAGGLLNKAFLASFLFAHPENAAKVNAIIHPRVKEHFKEWARKQRGADIMALESAILIESGFTDCVDKIALVVAPLKLRVERAVCRDRSSEDLVMKRIAAQLTDKERERYADFTLNNDNEIPLIPQIVQLVELLRKQMYF